MITYPAALNISRNIVGEVESMLRTATGVLQAMLLWIVLGGQPIVAAQTNSAPKTDTVLAQVAEPERDKSLDLLPNEVAELRRKVEKPAKDYWDKLYAVSGVISGSLVLVSGIVVACIGFYATNVYNRNQRDAEEKRKNDASNLEKEEFVSQKELERMRFDYEQKKWGEALASEVALKHLATRFTENSSLWSRVEVVARHHWSSGNLTKDVARKLAAGIMNWRYSAGGLLVEPTTRDAAFALQQAAWDFDGAAESYRRVRTARGILRDALRADMGVGEDSFGKSLIDVAAERRASIRSDLTKLQGQSYLRSEGDR